MAYADFTLETAETAFDLTSRIDDLFPGVIAEAVPAWLSEALDRGRAVVPLMTEKSRSEILVTPVLLAAGGFAPGRLAIYSGQRLDVDPGRGLVGECDFILARTAPTARLRAPLITILEAKKGDVEAGLGQCVAQMIAARLFNERAGELGSSPFGCVTSGQVWQFLRLDATEIVIDRNSLYIDNVGGILASLRRIIAPGAAVA